MKVIFLALSFPKIQKTKYLYSGLITEFRDNGHEVTIVAPTYDEKLTGLNLEDGVKFIRVKTLPLFNVGILKKGMATILLPHQYKRAIKKHNLALDYDLILTSTPPISLYSVIAWLKKKSKAKTYLILRDIFPQNAVDLGLINKRGAIHYYFRNKEKKLYSICDYIGCMSPGNISYVVKHNPNIRSNKFHLLPNWGDITPRIDKKDIIELRNAEGLQNKFVVIFGGNIGLPQKMENIVALAAACSDKKDIFFLIFGQGSERQKLERLIADKALSNLKLRNSLPQEEYSKWVQMADVGLISLSEKFTIPNIPSKALSYFNSKTPILASIDVNTDFGNILEDLNVGLWAEANQTHQLKEKLMTLYNEPELREKMGQNGYEHMKNFLSCEKAYKTVIGRIRGS